jgi:predicted alpha/beta hydrolase
MVDWGRLDLAGVLEWIGGHLRPSRLLVVGHSVGGQIVGVAEGNWRIHALLAVASQSGWWGHWPRPARYRIAFRWYLIPVITRLFGYLPGYFGTKEDLPAGVARQWAYWGRRPDYLMEEGVRAGFERFRGAILAYSFSDDGYAPRAAVEGLLDFYTQADIWHRHLKPTEVGAEEISHFGFFRDRFRETLWRDATAWLVKQASQPVIATTSSPATANLRSPLPGRTGTEPVKAPKAGSSPTASPKMKPGSLSLWRPKPESEIAG